MNAVAWSNVRKPDRPIDSLHRGLRQRPQTHHILDDDIEPTHAVNQPAPMIHDQQPDRYLPHRIVRLDQPSYRLGFPVDCVAEGVRLALFLYVGEGVDRSEGPRKNGLGSWTSRLGWRGRGTGCGGAGWTVIEFVGKLPVGVFVVLLVGSLDVAGVGAERGDRAHGPGGP